MDSRTIGILGGGQLGRMIVEAASRLNICTVILDAPNSPAKQINAGAHIDGSFSNPDDIAKIASQVDVLTVEIEHVDVPTLEAVALKYPNLEIYPAPETIRLIQDKYLQKEHLIKNKIAVAESCAVESTIEALRSTGAAYGYPYMLKSRTLAYDGRGNFVVNSEDSIPEALEVLKDRPLYAEKWCPFVKELAVMIVRTVNGEVFAYPTVETVHRDNICHLVYAPARVPHSVQYKASQLAQEAIKSFPGCGIFGVELFLLEDGSLVLNEIAPRPHNSGHFTIDACVTSQFEAHVRAVVGLPMPKDFTQLSTPNLNALMINVLGEEGASEMDMCKRALETPGASVYLYGKESRPNRKLGHINIISGCASDVDAKKEYILGGAAAELSSEKKQPIVSIIMGSDSDLPTMKAASEMLDKFDIPHEVTIVSAHRTPYLLTKFATEAHKRGVQVIIAGAGGAAHLPGMVAAMTPLPVIGVPVQGRVLDGMDSLYSICQMPRGVPVATVAIGNSTNAGLLAARMVGMTNVTVRNAMEKFLRDQEEEVLAKAERLETIGWKKYLE